MDSRIARILPFLLITVGCIVGVELFYFTLEKFVFIEKSPSRIAEVKPLEQPREKPVKRQAPVDYSIIMERNLFGPPAGKRVAAKQTDAKVEDLELTSLEVVLMGTIFGKNDDNRAIILTKKDRKQDIYRVGDQIQGAIIKEIRRGNIVLTVDGQDESLDMSEASKYAPRTPAGPVAANLPRRRAAVIPGSTSSTQSATTTNRVRPRVVRPTRKIVSSRRQPDQEDVPPSDSELMEPEEETTMQDTTE